MKTIAKTDIGLIRQTNEDTYTLIKKDDKNMLAFVCDGMGGHLGGSYASSKTVEFLNIAFSNIDFSKPFRNAGVWLFDTLQKANAYIYNQSVNDDNVKGMGTTVTGILMIDGVIHYAHVGDSRIYLYDHSHIEQLTTDHTYVNSLLLNGLINYKQAKNHPKRHVLTNALGIKKNISVDIGEIKLKEHQNLLICSDGLHNMVDDKRIFKILNEKVDIEEKGNILLMKALTNGGTDNITFILLEK